MASDPGRHRLARSVWIRRVNSVYYITRLRYESMYAIFFTNYTYAYDLRNHMVSQKDQVCIVSYHTFADLCITQMAYLVQCVFDKFLNKRAAPSKKGLR